MMNEMQQPPVSDIQANPEYGDTTKRELNDLGVEIIEQRGADTEALEDILFTVRPDREVKRLLTEEAPINNPILTFEVSRMPGDSGLIVINFASEEHPEDNIDIFLNDGEVYFDGNVGGIHDWAPASDELITSGSRIQIEIVNYNTYDARAKKNQQHHQILVSVINTIDGEEKAIPSLIRDVSPLPNDFIVNIIVENNGRNNFSTTISDISLRSSTRRGAR